MVAAPAVTPPPTLPAPVAAAIAPRQTTDFGYGYTYDLSSYTYGYGASCYAGVYSCDNGYLSCYTSAFLSDVSATQSCACRYGFDYLDCVFSDISKSSCWGFDYASTDWADYERSWFVSECGSLPPSIQAKIPPPTSVSLEFATVTIVTATGSITPTSHVDQPIYKGSGSLLAGDCSTAGFTLVDEGSTVYWAGFVGCVSDRPECCPWTVANSGPGGDDPHGNAPATTTGDGASPTGNTNDVAYPRPADSDQAVLKKCADDYISYSGGCCPNGYYPFTRAVGGQTPCWSSLNTETDAPTLTAGLAGQPTDTTKPTSAVINVVWAMQYPVGSGDKKLSTGAIAGIAVGGGIAAVSLGLIAIWLCLRRKRGKEKTPKGGPPAAGQVPNQAYAPGQHGQPAMTQQSPMSGTPMSNGGMPPPMGYAAPPPSGMQPQGYFAPAYDNRSSIATNQGQPQSPSPLAPQSTGTSTGGGTISEISSQSGQPLVANGHGYAPGYPSVIPEESQQHAYPPQCGAPLPQGQGQGQGQGGVPPGYGGPTSPQEQFYTPMSSPGQQQGGYYQNVNPQQQQQVPQQQGYFYHNQGAPQHHPQQQQQQQFYQQPPA